MVRFNREMWRGLAARVAIVGLVAQALVLAFHVPQAMRARGEGLSALSQTIICSVHSDRGSPARFVQADSEPPADPVAPGKTPYCPVCTALAACPLAAPPTLAVVPAPVAHPIAPARMADVTPPSGLTGAAVRNRGPPVPFV